MEWLAAGGEGEGEGKGGAGFLVSMYARADSAAILVFLGAGNGAHVTRR